MAEDVGPCVVLCRLSFLDAFARGIQPKRLMSRRVRNICRQKKPRSPLNRHLPQSISLYNSRTPFNQRSEPKTYRIKQSVLFQMPAFGHVLCRSPSRALIHPRISPGA